MNADLERFVAAHLGLNVASIGRRFLERAVEERMKVLALPRVEAYHARLERDPDELQALVEELVVPESWFFRNPEAFVALAAAAMAHRADEPFRVLSVPCASGEEPYSIAITLAEAGLPRARTRIDAIDISRRSLARAAAGVYRRNAFRDGVPATQGRYWDVTGDGVTVLPELRSRVAFAHGNLASDEFRTAAADYHVIFCRNVLIYFEPDVQRRAIDRLRDRLVPGGLLFVGPAEAVLAMERGLEPAGIPMAFACRRPLVPPAAAPRAVLRTVQPLLVPRPAPRRTAAPAVAPAPASVPSPDVPSLDTVRRLADDGQLVEAIDAVTHYLREHATSAEGWYLLALIHDATGRASQASECYRKARFLDPAHADAGLLLALGRRGGLAGAGR